MPQHDGFLNSELTAEIVKYLQESEEGLSATGIAEKMGKSRSSVSRALSKLHRKKIVKRVSEGQSNIYNIDYSGLSDYIYQKINMSSKERVSKDQLEVLYHDIFTNGDFNCLYDALFVYPLTWIDFILDDESDFSEIERKNFISTKNAFLEYHNMKKKKRE